MKFLSQIVSKHYIATNADSNEPTNEVAKFSRYIDKAASTAPPPGTTDLDSRTRLTTHRASCTERSISFTIKSLAPRNIIDAAVLAFVLQI